jgi:GNAT superfamily N-acetyltransferase
MADIEITLSDAEEPEASKVMLDALNAFNAAAAGPHGYTPLNLVVRRPGDPAPVGGINGGIFYGWLFIRLFYLPDDLRGGGRGAALLRRIEDVARARGCVGVHLDSFSFQAPEFYVKQGYTMFGAIDDFPPGHRRCFLMKRFDMAPPR